MKFSILHKNKIGLAVILIAIVVNARANGPLTSAFQSHGAPPNHSLFPRVLPNEVYTIDDGTAEESIGLTDGGDLICLNEFAVVPGAETITSVSIAWGSRQYFNHTLNGLPYLAVLWSDPNGDGDPQDGTVLGTALGVVSNQGTDTFLFTDLARTIPTSNFFVGFVVRHGAGQYPGAFDQTDPILSNRSYVAGSTTPPADIYDLNNNELPVLPIEHYGLLGNWLIRADGTSSSPLRLLTVASEIEQGEAGAFDINLPLSGPPAVECRHGIPGERERSYKWVFSFSQPILSVDDATVRCGAAQRTEIDPANPYQVDVFSTNHQCNGQYVTATLTGIHSASETLASASATMGILVGDVDGNGVVDEVDFDRVRRSIGEEAYFGNFRDDVSANGIVAPTDAKAVRGHAGDSLPPP